MKKIKNILILIVIICSIIYTFQAILDFNIYRILIRLSIIPIILIPCILKKTKLIDISSFNETNYIVYVFCAHFLGSIVNFYHKFYWYDNFMHFLSGILVFFYALELLIKTKKYDLKNLWWNALFILAISFMVSGLWEYFEFISDRIFNKDAQNVLTTGTTDTMMDMILVTLGSILSLITLTKKKFLNTYFKLIEKD